MGVCPNRRGARPLAWRRNLAHLGSTYSGEGRAAGASGPVLLPAAAFGRGRRAARTCLLRAAGRGPNGPQRKNGAGRELFEFERQCRVSVLKELSDEELYRLMRKGNQLAFAQLYERRQPPIYRYALHMSGSHAAGEESPTKCLSG